MKRSNILATTLFLLHISFQITYSQVTQDWSKRYNGPGNTNDETRAITLDSSENVYVTGYSIGNGSGQDYATIKYNSAGAIQWLKRYNGSGNGHDFGNSIATDALGNVYVTGGSLDSNGYTTFLTIKYDLSGVQQWVKRYNGGNYYDVATSIKVDNSGSIYVTGYSWRSGTLYDYATIKYNSNGDSLWVQRYNGPGNNEDYAISMSVDTSGNVYITGHSRGSGTGFDYATIKYNSSGIQQWVQRYNGAGNNNDYPPAIVTDGSGNVYITGQSDGISSGVDYATIKYNSLGVQQWVQRYNGTANGYDGAKSIAVDGFGNVYVTGQSDSIGSGLDYVTIKYNSSGIQKWIKRYNGSGNANDFFTSLVIDSYSNVYVTGQSHDSLTGDDFVTIKYNTNGESLWIQKYNGPANSDDGANAILVNSNSGNVFATGNSLGNGTGSDYATVKYSQQSTNLNLTLLIEGFYDNITNKMVTDTVKVNLRNSNSPYVIIDSAKLFLDSNGYTTYSFPNAVKGLSYYIVIQHRNSIETWSKQAVLFSYKTNYDFTTSANKAFGDNLVLKESKYCVYSGDANQDEIIDVADIILVYNDANNSEVGYVKTDLNGDYFVDVSDIIIAYNNTNNIVSVIKP